jgi:VIT1/CCC1 family predicted Fe2+/Mn2+ transporter
MDTATAPRRASRERVLDPIARISEILFGLIMALTFTGTLSAAEAGQADIRALLLGAIGCNIAWGLVDAVMYLVSTLTERGHDLVTIRAVRAAATPTDAHRVIAAAVSPMMARILATDDIERVRQRLIALPAVPARPALTADDWRGALGVFLLVVLSTFPLVVPFLVFDDARLAIRASHATAIVLLFVSGAMLARVGGYRPLLTGVSMVVLGVALVATAIALGG